MELLISLIKKTNMDQTYILNEITNQFFLASFLNRLYLSTFTVFLIRSKKK